MSRLADLVRAFTSEEGHSLVEALFDALPADERHAFEAEVEAYREDINDLRAALADETQPAASLPEHTKGM